MPCTDVPVLLGAIGVVAVVFAGDYLYGRLPATTPASVDGLVRCTKLVSHTLMAACCGVIVYTDGNNWLDARHLAPLMACAIYKYQFVAWSTFAVVDPFLHGGSSVLYALHHAVTLALIAGSSATGWEVCGCVVMFVSDAPDVFLSALKLATDDSWRLRCFAAFTATFIACRMMVLPVFVVIPAVHHAWNSPNDLVFHGLVAGLVALQALNAYWMGALCKAAAAVRAGTPLDALTRRAA